MLQPWIKRRRSSSDKSARCATRFQGLRRCPACRKRRSSRRLLRPLANQSASFRRQSSATQLMARFYARNVIVPRSLASAARTFCYLISPPVSGATMGAAIPKACYRAVTLRAAAHSATCITKADDSMALGARPHSVLMSLCHPVNVRYAQMSSGLLRTCRRRGGGRIRYSVEVAGT
jgi:hypothetical protein